ncbi:MAG: hypothetical protein ACT4OS_07585 [Acidimicrobiales bacterium]
MLSVDDRRAELVEILRHMIDQLADESESALARVSSAIAVGGYMEALTRSLVAEARSQGASWDDLGHSFGTTGVNVSARFGDYRRYDDDDDDDIISGDGEPAASATDGGAADVPGEAPAEAGS